MEKQYEKLREKLVKMEIVKLSEAVDFAQASREEIIDFVNSEGLRIFDDLNGRWVNENVDGHC